MDRIEGYRITAAMLALCCVFAAVTVGAVAGVGSVASDTTPTPAVDVSADAGGPAPASSPDSGGDTVRTAPLTQCFAGDGYPISIGDHGATIDAVVHLSVITDPSVGNEFGIEAAGALDDDQIITLATGVRLTAREAIADGFNPFSAFDVLYTYELRLPMFDGAIGESEYQDEGSPITSAAGAVPC